MSGSAGFRAAICSRGGLGLRAINKISTAVCEQQPLVVHAFHWGARQHRLDEDRRWAVPVRGDVVNDADRCDIDATRVRHEEVFAESWSIKLTERADVKASAGHRLPRIDTQFCEPQEELRLNGAFRKRFVGTEPTYCEQRLAGQGKIRQRSRSAMVVIVYMSNLVDFNPNHCC